MAEQNLDYDKLLDEWADRITQKADKSRESADDAEEGSYKHGRLVGYSDGLIMAISVLNRMESIAKRKLSKE